MNGLTLEDASNIINHIISFAREENTAPLGVIVLDAGGHIISYKRENGATSLRYDIAKGKASGAISLGMNSRKFAEMAEQRPVFVSTLATMTGGNFVPSAGGVLIKSSQGDVLGVVGVSGDWPDMDEKCATHGIKESGFSI